MSQLSLLGAGSSSEPSELQHRIIEDPERGWEKWWLRANERINPIVVKEVRQSLKSRQFTIAFGLTLIVAVAWTLIAISLMVPRIFYIPAGVPLLSGYFCILAAPLMVIIPFGAFLSLTAETEDGTFELLSISALSALQIVHGKMASACVQILLYLSALAPCIVLTYLLRGVGLYTIVVFLGWTVALSVAETALALLLGAVARTRMMQVGAAVLALAGLFLGVGVWLSFLLSAGLSQFSTPATADLVIQTAMLCMLAASVSLVLRSAAAAIDFPSENHSTPLRLRIFFWLLLLIFWSLLGIMVAQELSASMTVLIAVFIFLMFVGTLLTGERGIISPRAQRGLPRTFLGRVFLTWLYPGAGLGTVYVICLFAALVGTLAAVDFFSMWNTQTMRRDSGSLIAGYLLLCYLAFYVGLNRLVMLLIPRPLPGRMMIALVLMACVLIVAHLLPLFVVYYANDYREFPYAWHQAFNIFWTIDEVGDFNSISLDIGPSLVIVTLCAVAIFGLNLLFCTRDVMLLRVIAPPRVREEEMSNTPVTTVPADPFAD